MLAWPAYDPSARHVRYRSDKADGPKAGSETAHPLEFVAPVTAHIPNKRQVLARCYGYYATRCRASSSRRRAPPPPAASRRTARAAYSQCR
jgi:hypothetical protein